MPKFLLPRISAPLLMTIRVQNGKAGGRDARPLHDDKGEKRPAAAA